MPTTTTIAAGSSASISLPVGSSLSLTGYGTAQLAPPVPAGSDGSLRQLLPTETRLGPFAVAVTVNVVALSAVSYYTLAPTDILDARALQSLTAAQAAAVAAALKTGQKRMVFVGRSFPFGALIAAGGTDIGGTTRRKYTSISPLSVVKGLHFTHFFTSGTNGDTEGDSSVSRNINVARLAVEYPTSSGHIAYDSVRGRTTWVVDPTAPVMETDGVGVNIPAASDFCSRFYTRQSIPPTSPSAAAVNGGALTDATTYYYVVTAIDNEIESGPTAEFSGTTSSPNLALNLTWTANANASRYRIYRSAASAGTKQFLFETVGPVVKTQDAGFYAQQSSINPPTAASYRFNCYLPTTADSENHVNQGGGSGADVTGSTGTTTTSGASTSFGCCAAALVGDDTSGKSILFIGDSIGEGRGWTNVTAAMASNKNFFDVAFTDGQYHTCNASRRSTTLLELLTPTVAGGGRTRLKLIQYANVVLCQLGINDLGYLSTTWQQLAAEHIVLATMCYQRGIPYYATTLTPYTTSTDNCVTVANQTISARETNRTGFNNWLRNGRLMSGTTPVLTGGTASPYISGYVEVANTVEVNASNVLTQDGGFWRVPAAATLTGQILTGSPSTTSLPVGAASYTTNAHVGRVVKMTSGAKVGEVAVVASNTATAITVYANGSTAQSGVANTGFSGAPAAGDTFDIYDVYTNEGLHPAIAGHAAMGVPVTAWAAVATA